MFLGFLKLKAVRENRERRRPVKEEYGLIFDRSPTPASRPSNYTCVAHRCPISHAVTPECKWRHVDMNDLDTHSGCTAPHPLGCPQQWLLFIHHLRELMGQCQNSFLPFFLHVGDKHGCWSQHVSNSILIPPVSNTFHFCHHPQPHHSQPYHAQSIIYHPSFIINGNSKYWAYSITISIFLIFNRLPSLLCPPLNSVKWSSPQNNSCHRR